MEYLIAGLLVMIVFATCLFWPRKQSPMSENKPRQICIHSKDKDGNDIILTKELRN